MCAYNYWCAGTDWATSGRPASGRATRSSCTPGRQAQPLRACTNNASRTARSHSTDTTTADGTPEMPIAIKAAGDGEAIFDGDGNFALFDVKAADYTYFEGLTFRNAEVASPPGRSSLPARRG